LQKLASNTITEIYNTASGVTKDEFVEKAKNIKDSLIFHVSLGYNIVNHSEETHRWWDRITDNIVVGALPFHDRDHLNKLQLENIRSVVILCREYEFNPVLGKPVTKQDWENQNVKVLHSPTRDFEAPTVEELYNCVSWINKQIEEDPKSSVYVHCKAGRGRSVALVVCFLISNMGFTTDEAIQFIVSKRSHINMGTSQIEACRKYEQEYRPLSMPPRHPPIDLNPFPNTSDIISSELINSIENSPQKPNLSEISQMKTEKEEMMGEELNSNQEISPDNVEQDTERPIVPADIHNY
jgi:atypical dual specificity phosphatase